VGSNGNRQIVDVTVAAGNDPDGVFDTGLNKRSCFGAIAGNLLVGICGARVDYGQLNAGGQ
jgi:hypothetical protein